MTVQGGRGGEGQEGVQGHGRQKGGFLGVMFGVVGYFGAHINNEASCTFSQRAIQRGWGRRG